jgi:ABC-2 type transport system ATP-binding protein
VIELRNLTRRFGELAAVNGLTLSVSAGEIVGLVGPDGAGKTTTLRLITGLLDASEGSVTVAGLDVAQHPDQVKDAIGYMAQRFGLYADLTVEENMIFYADLFGVTGAERDAMMAEYLRMTRMEPFRQRPAGKLSGGMKQKLALMCTLLHRPRVLLLDEPTNGVDPVSRRDFWALLYRLVKDGLTVLVTTAYLDEAERCNRVGLMNRGQLIAMDNPRALKKLLPESCYEIEVPNARAARQQLLAHPAILSAEPSGLAIHAFTQLTDRDLTALLPDARIARIEPSLEDVFIALVRREEVTHAA